jgi:uncharacterized protein YjbJ (UPF0337 family)
MKNPIMQKMEGKLQQAQGKIKELSGDKLGGMEDQIRGKAEEEIAEARIRINRSRTPARNEERMVDAKAREEQARQSADSDIDNQEEDYI